MLLTLFQTDHCRRDWILTLECLYYLKILFRCAFYLQIN
jgi:hypothetical protein